MLYRAGLLVALLGSSVLLAIIILSVPGGILWGISLALNLLALGGLAMAMARERSIRRHLSQTTPLVRRLGLEGLAGRLEDDRIRALEAEAGVMVLSRLLAHLDRTRIMEAGLRALSAALDAKACMVLAYDPFAGAVRRYELIEDRFTAAWESVEEVVGPLGEIRSFASALAPCLTLEGQAPCLVVPLTTFAKEYGALGLWCHEELRPYQERLARGVSFYLAQAHERGGFYDVATQEGSSSLLKAPFLESLLGQEVDWGRRSERPLSVLVVAVDGLDQLRADHGQNAVDRVLAALGGLVIDRLREHDLAARQGNDTIAIVRPNQSRSSSIKLAEAIRNAVKQYRFPVNGGTGLHLTVSVGVATYPDDGEGTGALLEAAERQAGLTRDVKQD